MIYAIHGIVQNYSQENFCHRNLLDAHQFEELIATRPEKFVNLTEALAGNGDAITIDDASYAAYDAALILRKHDHAVTLFINPYNIVNRSNYWFHQLNYILENLSPPFIDFNEKRYNLSTYKEKLQFRTELKLAISNLHNEQEKYEIITKLFAQSSNIITLPLYLNILTHDAIVELFNAGVDIQNHGWTHRELKDATMEEMSDQLYAGKKWIESILGYAPNFFCAPFGAALPPANLSDFDCWFALSSKFPLGFIGNKIYNRLTLGF